MIAVLIALVVAACSPPPGPDGRATAAASPTGVTAVAPGAAPTSTPASAPAASARVSPATPSAAPATATVAVPTPRPKSKNVVLGYYVPYDSTSWQSLQAHADSLDYVAAQWVTVDYCGGLTSRDDRTLVAFAREHGITVLPSLLTSSPELNHELLADPATTRHFREQIVEYVVDEGYAGIDLDLEGIDQADREAYSDFVAGLAAALHREGKLLVLATPAKTSDVRTGWAGPYDYAAIGQQADLILLMAYEFSWPASPPGSIAPRGWVDKVAAYATSQIPAEKVLLGIAFYGYDWNVTSGAPAKSVVYPQAALTAQQFGETIGHDTASGSATFSYTLAPDEQRPAAPTAPALQHEISVRKPARCGPPPGPTPTPSPPTPTPSPTPLPSKPQGHEVWIEDAASVGNHLDTARRYDLAGIGTWRLGQEDPAVWTRLADFRRAP
jgi:spore germination protein